MATVLQIDACDLLYAQDAVRALLHTVLFNRLFGQVVPKQHEILDITVAAVDDPRLEALVDERAATYVQALRTAQAAGATRKMPVLAIDFYEKRTRKGWFLGRAEEQVCWESWQIAIGALTSTRSSDAQSQGQHRRRLEEAVQACMMQVIRTVNDRNDAYIPPIPYNEGNTPFPYVIEVRTAGQVEAQATATASAAPAHDEPEGWFR
jgi:hypothetical protein